MPKPKRVRKRCTVCGKARMYRAREKRCKMMEHNAMGKSGYWCYGLLRPAPKAKARQWVYVNGIKIIDRGD